MIISKAPLRISFVGGGSDLPAYFQKDVGSVVSVTIDKYVYVCVNKKFDGGIRVSYSKTENVSTVEQIEHPIVRESLRHFNINNGIEIVTVADIPGTGTGLGSSSSFTVALCRALADYTGCSLGAQELAELAFYIEMDRCGAPVGKQDQYAAAFGGLNFIQFFSNGDVKVERLKVSDGYLERLKKSAALIYTGRARSASAILKVQQHEIANDDQKWGLTRKIVETSQRFLGLLQQEAPVSKLAELLDISWRLKRAQSAGISDSELDTLYEKYIQAGLWGGKLLGAGGGGFFLLLGSEQSVRQLSEASNKNNFVKFNFCSVGVTSRRF